MDVKKKVCNLSFVACNIKILLSCEHFLAFRHVKSGKQKPMSRTKAQLCSRLKRI